MEIKKSSIDIVKSLSLENVQNLENYARTTVSDYYIKRGSFCFKNSIIKTSCVSIFEADWKYTRVCVKELMLQQNHDVLKTIHRVDSGTFKKPSRKSSGRNGGSGRKLKDEDIKPENNLGKEIQNELLLLSKCIHPKIVQFLGFSKDKTSVYLIFEYMHNGNLYEFIKTSSDKLTAIEKIQIFLDITSALHYLHTRSPNKIIHRDIKPSNILVNKHCEAKLADFGISKILQLNNEDNSKKNSHEKGTYVWMAPEVVNGDEYSYGADIYSLGLVMHFVWTEKVPFHEYKVNTVQLMFMKIQNTLELPDIEGNAKLNQLIKSCTTFDMQERPVASSVIEALYEILDSEKN